MENKSGLHSSWRPDNNNKPRSLGWLGMNPRINGGRYRSLFFYLFKFTQGVIICNTILSGHIGNTKRTDYLVGVINEKG